MEDRNEIEQHTRLACMRAKAYPTPEHEESRRNALRVYERAFGYPFDDSGVQEEAARVLAENKRINALRRARSKAVRNGRMPA